MTVAPSNTIRVTCQQQDANGSVIQNVFFYRHDGAGNIADAVFMTAVEVEMSDLFTTIQAYIPNTCEPVSISADLVIFTGGKLNKVYTVGEVPWTTWAGGTGSGDALPQGCAAITNFSTATPGVVGRKYLGPLTETANENGILASAFQTALAAFVAELIDGFIMSTNQMTPIVMSTKMAMAIPLVEGIVKSIVGYQRRRKPGVGV